MNIKEFKKLYLERKGHFEVLNEQEFAESWANYKMSQVRQEFNLNELEIIEFSDEEYKVVTLDQLIKDSKECMDYDGFIPWRNCGTVEKFFKSNSKPLPSEEEISSFLKNLNIWEDQTDCFDKGTAFWENGGLSGVIQKALQWLLDNSK